MSGQFESMRSLPPELHEAATRLVAEAMASGAVEAISDPHAINERLARLAADSSVVDAFIDRASDFVDIRGDLVEAFLPEVKS